MSKERIQIGGLNIIKGAVVTSGGEVFDSIEGHIIDPVTGNKIKFNGIIPKAESKFPHQRKVGGVVKNFKQKYVAVKFNGIQLTGSDEMDYDFKPKFSVEAKVKEKPATKATITKAVEDDLFGI